MTKYQAIALRHPCLLGEETAHPRFGHAFSVHGATLVLTVNAGYD